MVDQSRADLVMRFTDKYGAPILAESTLDVDSKDSLMEGFEPTSSADDYSNFFEVNTFSFAIVVKPGDKDIGALSKQTAAAAAAKGTSPVAADAFLRWRSADEGDYRKIHYPVEFNAFNFTRLLDAASMPFFMSCCNSTSFKSAALVKRVSVGTAGDDTKKPMGFLRFDFRDVLMTGVNWDDGDLVSESCTFICRAMRVRYKQQSAAGSLPATYSTQAVWPNPAPLGGDVLDSVLLAMIQELTYGR